MQPSGSILRLHKAEGAGDPKHRLAGRNDFKALTEESFRLEEDYRPIFTLAMMMNPTI